MSASGLKIKSISSFSPKDAFLNGVQFLSNGESAPFNTFAKEVYYAMAPSYSKFFKMDELCKLAFLSTELLLKDQEISRNSDGSDIALVLANKDSSVASDKKHVAAIRDKETFFPSPAVFVYTLPNIMLGEICIRHQITGENTCFIMDDFDSKLVYDYVVRLFQKEFYSHCITGWVNYANDENYLSKLFLIGKNLEAGRDSIEFTPDFFKI